MMATTTTQQQVSLTAGQLRVSSVLNKDAKQFGRQNMIDGNEETCWNSDQGSPQFVQIRFECPTKVDLLKIMFQGGFSAKVRLSSVSSPHPQLTREGQQKKKELKVVIKYESGESSETIFYPSDNNSLQISFLCIVWLCVA